MTPAEIAALREVAIRARFHSLMSVPPSTVLSLLTLAEQAVRLREAAQQAAAWTKAIQICAPELDGAYQAFVNLRAAVEGKP